MNSLQKIVVLCVAILLGIGIFAGGYQLASRDNNIEISSEADILDESVGVKEESVPSTTKTPVKTNSTVTKPKADTIVAPSVSKTGRVRVVYTNEGFSPFVAEVTAGQVVDFVNNSDKPLWVTSNLHPTAKDQYYPEFDAGKSISRGETYSFMFTLEGTWGYKNLNNQEHLGAVAVSPQR